MNYFPLFCGWYPLGVVVCRASPCFLFFFFSFFGQEGERHCLFNMLLQIWMLSFLCFFPSFCWFCWVVAVVGSQTTDALPILPTSLYQRLFWYGLCCFWLLRGWFVKLDENRWQGFYLMYLGWGWLTRCGFWWMETEGSS